MKPQMVGTLLLIAMSGSTASAFNVGAKVKSVHVVSEGEEVRIEVELTAPATPIIKELGNPSRMVIDFPDAFIGNQAQRLKLYRSGVYEIQVGARMSNASNARIVVGIDSALPYGIQALGNTLVLSILLHPSAAALAAAATSLRPVVATKAPEDVDKVEVTSPMSPVPDLEAAPLESTIEALAAELADVVRRSFKVRYISEDTVYLDGGTNSGVRTGMEFDINRPKSVVTSGGPANSQNAFVASVRVIGVAAASAVTELVTEDRTIRVGDLAELTPKDAAAAAGNLLSVSHGQIENVIPANQETGSSSTADSAESHFVRLPPGNETVNATGMAGRITFDSSAITSFGSTPGTTMQNGISFQSDMTGILRSHWNLQGYWRGRINRHSQFHEPTIEESLNKTYTMQLYYDNPDAK
jgi:hypothetical protein